MASGFQSATCRAFNGTRPERAMPQYRAYVLDSAGKFFGPPHEMVCQDDEAAIAKAWQLTGYGVEVWQGSRLVMRLPARAPGPTSGESPGGSSAT